MPCYRYITYNATLPEHSLSSVKILCWVCQSALVQPKLVGLFTANSVSLQLRCVSFGFVVITILVLMIYLIYLN